MDKGLQVPTQLSRHAGHARPHCPKHGQVGVREQEQEHLYAVIGNNRLAEITAFDLETYQNKRLGDGMSAHSVNKECRLWSQILKKAKLWARLRDDYRQIRTEVTDIGRALTRDELRELARIAQTNKGWEASFYGSVLAANTGMRNGEVRKLKIRAIDLTRRQLIIRRKSTKTNAGARHIELNRDALESIERSLLRAREHGATAPDHYLMPKHLSRINHGPHKGERGYDPNQHQMCWDTAWHNLTSAVQCPKCGQLQAPTENCREESCAADMRTLKSVFLGFRFHDLRHTFITHMVERGVAWGVIESFVGHMSNRMIRHYTHITTGAARRAVELLDQEPLLAAAPPPQPSISQPPINPRPM